MNKGLSVLLTLTIVLSAMLCSFTASSAAEIIYYVSATGSDTNNGTTQSTPVTSVAKAVELANLNYGEEDTVTIKVMGTQNVQFVIQNKMKILRLLQLVSCYRVFCLK